MKWIPVTQELPPIGIPVLLYQTWPKDTAFNCMAMPLTRCFVYVGGLRYTGEYINYEHQFSEGLKNITYWMELPEEPVEFVE